MAIKGKQIVHIDCKKYIQMHINVSAYPKIQNKFLYHTS